MSDSRESVGLLRSEIGPPAKRDLLHESEGHAAAMVEPNRDASTGEDWATACDEVDEAMWDVFLADDELEPLPEPGDFD